MFQVCFKRCNCKMSTNRGALWSDCEVRALIAVWGESNVQEELDGAVRNKVIFVAISDKLLQQGYNRDWQQCRTKIKNLKKEYRVVRTTMGKQEEEEKHASSSVNWTPFLVTGQLQPPLCCSTREQAAQVKQTPKMKREK